MTGRTSFPWGAASFAFVACVVLAIYGAPLALVLAVLVVWCASLWLVTASPPDPSVRPAPASFDEGQMGDLFELSETPVVVTKRDRVIIGNAAARKLLGAHMLGQDIRMVLRNPAAVRLVEAGEDGGVTISGLGRRKDIWRVNRKGLPGEMGVLEFINRTSEANISRAHTDFVANASHELRTPLASIIGYVETLREEAGDTDAQTLDRFLSTIQREARRLQSLVEDLMSLSRIEAEKHELPAKRLDFAALVERAARDAAGPDRSARLDLALEPGIAIQGDSQQLEQMVRNLVDNALKYGGAEESVTVSLAAPTAEQAVLSVTDRGDGIAAEHLPHLTRRFYRTDPGRSRASGGTGLGLAIVKHVVERHRGKLDIASTQGIGTTVTIRFARAPASAQEPEMADSLPLSHN